MEIEMVPSDKQNTTDEQKTVIEHNTDSVQNLTPDLTRQQKKNVVKIDDPKSDCVSEASETIIQQRKNGEKRISKKRQGSKHTFSPSIRKKITKKMSQAFRSRSNSAAARVDISGFQTTEHEKTIVRKNLRRHATILFFLAVTATALVLLDTQIRIFWKQQKILLAALQPNDTAGLKIMNEEKDKLKFYQDLGTALKSILSVVSVLTCISLLSYYKNLFRLKKVRHYYPQKMSFIRATPLVKKYVIECCICFFHVPPLVDFYVDVPNEVQIFVILRLYLLGRYLKEKHELMNSQSTRFLASVTKTELTSMFLFKTFFMQYPFQLILLAYIILLFIGGYGVWLIESRYSYLDTVWMLIITMTTVGFGDLTPKTGLGRFCVGITAIVGIFLMALFISLVNEALMLQRREKRILAYVENQDLTRHRKITALNAIGMWYKYHSHMKRHPINFSESSVSFLGGRSNYHQRGTTQKGILNKMKAKILETEMFQAINDWRRVKNARGGNYFAQEFMIEDMKNMMSDLNSKVNEIDEKMEQMEVFFSHNNNNQKKENDQKSQKQKEENHHGNNQNCNPISVNFPSESKCNGTDRLYSHYHHSNRNNGINDLEVDNTTFHMERFVRNYPKSVKDLLRESRDGGSSQIIRKNELVIAFKLLKNQAKIMNNGLDDVYYKTKQDITDLENLINSLLICTDAEFDLNDQQHYVLPRELPV